MRNTTLSATTGVLGSAAAEAPVGPDVSVIIVNWNTREYLRDCLASVIAQTREMSYEVIVIDNASTDGTPEMVQREFPHVTFIASPDNRGFAAANNQGLRIARGRYLLLLNPDTLVLDGCIDKCVRFADDHPEYGVVGCQVLENESDVQLTCFRFPSPYNVLLSVTGLPSLCRRSNLFNREHLGAWQRDTQREVDVVSGMFMLVRREAFNQVGSMDEDYFLYAEEADWCYRFRQANWRSVFAPVGRIIHREGGGKSTRSMSVSAFVQQQKSLLIFHRKNLGWTAWVAARLLFTVAMLQRSVIWTLWSLCTRSAPARQKAKCATAALKYHLLGIEPPK